MRIGYCSPLNPNKSGISDFSEELICKLKDYVDITLFCLVEPENEYIRKNYKWYLIDQLDREEIRRELDLIVYHVGNNILFHNEIVNMLFKYPGIVEFHDISIHNMMEMRVRAVHGDEAYLELVRYCHGQKGVDLVMPYFRGETEELPWLKYGLEMTMNRQLVDSAMAVIVHSDLAKQMILANKPGKPIVNIPLHSELASEPLDQLQKKNREALDIPQGKLVFGSFGYASAEKRIPQIVRALSQFKKNYGKNFQYYIVGNVAESLNLKEMIKELDLSEQVVITGFVTLEQFNSYIGACDFCLNLRYPTHGESSASLHRMLGMGKPVVVTDVGTFCEYPDEYVLKVRSDEHEEDDIYQALVQMAQNCKDMSADVHAYAVKNFSIDANAALYAEFFKQIKLQNWQPDWMDTFVDRLLELGLTNPEYTQHVSQMLAKE